MRKIIGYLLLIGLIAIGIFVWRNQLNKIKNESNQQIAQAQEEFYNTFKQNLENSPKNSFQLVVLGKKMLDRNFFQAAEAYFEVAAKKDQNYRDAYFYLGYSYLRVSENERSNERSDRTTGTIRQSAEIEQALTAFLKARDLDPLYAPTYEFLAYTYNKLGDAENARLAYEKAQKLQ